MAHPDPCPHDPIEEIGRDVFMVRGSIRMNPLMRITRNMAILRQDGELTLVDPIRLNEAEEARLRGLGEVRRLLRLGPMHGQDDAYYKERFGAELWAAGASQSHPEPKIDRILPPGAELPIEGAELFHFEGAAQAEAAIRLERGPGLLLTCDAIQHYGDYRHNTLLARMALPFIGFPKRTVVGPIWLKVMTPEGGSLEPSFRRLLALRFDQLLAAHGSFLAAGAHASVARAIDEAFAKS